MPEEKKYLTPQDNQSLNELLNESSASLNAADRLAVWNLVNYHELFTQEEVRQFCFKSEEPSSLISVLKNVKSSEYLIQSLDILKAEFKIEYRNNLCDHILLLQDDRFIPLFSKNNFLNKMLSSIDDFYKFARFSCIIKDNEVCSFLQRQLNSVDEALAFSDTQLDNLIDGFYNAERIKWIEDKVFTLEESLNFSSEQVKFYLDCQEHKIAFSCVPLLSSLQKRVLQDIFKAQDMRKYEWIKKQALANPLLHGDAFSKRKLKDIVQDSLAQTMLDIPENILEQAFSLCKSNGLPQLVNAGLPYELALSLTKEQRDVFQNLWGLGRLDVIETRISELKEILETDPDTDFSVLSREWGVLQRGKRTLKEALGEALLPEQVKEETSSSSTAPAGAARLSVFPAPHVSTAGPFSPSPPSPSK